MSTSTTRGQSPPPSPPSFADERAQKQFIKLRKKLENRTKANPTNTPSADMPPVSPKKDNNNTGKLKDHNQNGMPELVSSTSENTDIQSEEELLSKRIRELKLPQVHDVSARCATISWDPVEAVIADPNAEKEMNDLLKDLDISYQIVLGEKRKPNKEKHSRVLKECTCRFSSLQPATDYWIQLSALVDLVKIKETLMVEFQTKACPPDIPLPPLVQNRTKNSLVVRWLPPADNGSSILYYILECDDGTGCEKFSEVYRGKNKQYAVSKLQLSTQYCLRLAAYNDMGISGWSEVISVSTMGAPPAPPVPPTLKDASAQHISLSWIPAAVDQLFTLQIADPISGHGFLNVYHGSDCEYSCTGLTRNAPYRLRLQAQNENGTSRWSNEVTFSTTADHPGTPSRLSVKGRIHAHSFRVRWEAPHDTGGSSITSYCLQLDSGNGFSSIWTGFDTEFLCDKLTPGTTHLVRISCSNDIHQSEFSEPLIVITEPVCPGQCAAPRLNGKPRANSLQLKWECPEFDGGSVVTQYEVNVINPDRTSRIVYTGFDCECLVASLLPGRSYSFQVRASNKIGVGAWSSSLETLSGPGAPEPPSIPVLINRSSHSIALSWNEPLSNGSPVTEYRLEMASNPNMKKSSSYNCVTEATDESAMMNLENPSFLLVHAGASTQHEIKGLHPVTTYFFRIQAVNLVGVSSYSSSAIFTTLASSPAAVSGLRCVAVDSKSFTLSWNVPHSNGSTITHYNIELGDKWTVSTKDPTTTLHVENLNPDTLFRLRVQAVNAIGVGPYSSVLKCSTRPLPPSPPRLECAQISHNCLKLRWGDGKNLDFTQYSVEMQREGSEEFHLVYEGASQSYKMSKLTECTCYKFRICARNEVGDGPYSDVLEVTTVRAPPPILKKPDILDLNETNCRICWSAYRLPSHSDLVTYQVEVTRTKDQEQIMVKRCNESEISVSGLSARTEYSVRVFAIRSREEGDISGAYSPSRIFTTPFSQDASLNDFQKNSSIEMTEKLSKPLTDQHWALIIISAFIAFSILIAVFMNQLVVT